MCYSSSKDFGWGIRKEADSKPEAKQETTEKPVKAQDFTFWAFPGWRKTRAPGTPSAERSKERV
ncbi:hypothetical protein [Arthrobacter sp. OY3WO11]|uniref:hypothetical protein n=1 Tax=Arthrobacter sp. OY3WO11 TaxID=1835723 RepID=UPI0007CFE993|nr:hypothetical protein [Arthrobacter sp. OY3WO11]OAE00374.1 hypothetical protein A6A22_02175 [Arthrobacter sp. OY3WO11]